MWKRRRLLERSPSSVRARDDATSSAPQHVFDTDDFYELSGECFSGSIQQRIPRPMPASNILALNSSCAPSRKKSNETLQPILRSFLVSIGRQSDVEKDDQQQKSDSLDHAEDINVAAIDDPRRSTLSIGQHRQYMHLLSSKKEWRRNQYREFHKLNALVEAEQQQYCQALIEFWEINKNRILVGFTHSVASSMATKFVQFAAYPDTVKASWRKRFDGVKFGKCCQVISLELSGQQERKNSWSVDAIESHAVSEEASHASKDSCEPAESLALPDIGSDVPVPTQHRTLHFLRDDKTALMVAKREKVDIVAALEALEAVMDHEDAQWILPVSFREGIAFLDLPLPQTYSSPRACLTKGLNEGLSQWTDVSEGVQENKEQDKPHRYVLLTVPRACNFIALSGKGQKQKQIRILVRIPNSQTRIRAHVEYFFERGEEIPSSSERSSWILDSFLFRRALVAKVDPRSCQILKCEETSVAHALAGTDGGTALSANHSTYDPMDHWHRLAKLLYAIPTIGHQGDFVLCFPGRDMPHFQSQAVSVHAETETESTIDIAQEISRAGEVQLGAAGIRRSLNDWIWTDERVPCTFPVSSSPKKDT